MLPPTILAPQLSHLTLTTLPYQQTRCVGTRPVLQLSALFGYYYRSSSENSIQARSAYGLHGVRLNRHTIMGWLGRFSQGSTVRYPVDNICGMVKNVLMIECHSIIDNIELITYPLIQPSTKFFSQLQINCKLNELYCDAVSRLL